MSQNLPEINTKVQEASAWVSLLKSEINKVIVGQNYMVERLLVGILANGHILLEGVPGLAKTLTVKSLAACLQADFHRIQFTPDLLPADILGTLIYNPKEGEFHTQKGPIFANIILADEINRAPAKVQSALLEAMQEKQVTIGKESFALPNPFLVLATENPVDQEGTYPLPEAQVDRFLLKLKIGYPQKHEEREILEKASLVNKAQVDINAILSPQQILQMQSVVEEIYVDEKIKDYIIDLVFATRKPSDYKIDYDQFVAFGASPRATIALIQSSKAYAFLKGRGFVTPQDIKSIGLDVLRHRIIPSFEAEAEEITSETIVNKILASLPVP